MPTFVARKFALSASKGIYKKKVTFFQPSQTINQTIINQGNAALALNNYDVLLAAVDTINRCYFSRLQKEAIAGKIILRDEVVPIVDKLTSPENKRSILVTGQAGVGKSGVIHQTMEALIQKSVPLIAFRVDRLTPTQSPNQVGEQLENLPTSPAHVLGNIAQGRDCVLVIDQLDAVSTASGRISDFFDCIEQIVDQAKDYPKMRLLLACRKFDLYQFTMKVH